MTRTYQETAAVVGHDVNSRILRAVKQNDQQHQRAIAELERELAELRAEIRELRSER